MNTEAVLSQGHKAWRKVVYLLCSYQVEEEDVNPKQSKEKGCR